MNLGGEAGSGATVVNFTHRPGAADPLRDGAETQYDLTTGRRRFAEAEFSTFNDQLKDTSFYELYQKLPFAVGRMRVRSLAPGKVMTMHADTSPRAHVALATNPFCYLTTASGRCTTCRQTGTSMSSTRGWSTPRSTPPSSRGCNWPSLWPTRRPASPDRRHRDTAGPLPSPVQPLR